MSVSEFLCFEFKIIPVKQGSEILIAQLSQIGFDSFQENNDGVSAYILKNCYVKDSIDDIQIFTNKNFKITYSENNILKQNWNKTWEDNYEPTFIDNVCCIRAPFHKISKLKYDIVIEPKMSFGTGHHETTELMMKFILESDLVGSTVCDVGCGTGVLSILSEKVGAVKVDALDIDNWSYQNSLENIKKNNCFNIQVNQGEVVILKHNTYDNIFANINLNVLLNDIKMYESILNNSGCLFLSGFLKNDIKLIQDKCSNLSMKLSKTKIKNNWVALKFIKDEKL